MIDWKRFKGLLGERKVAAALMLVAIGLDLRRLVIKA